MSTITISLPTQITKRVDLETKKQGYSTRSEFIRSLLRKYFSSELEFEPFENIPIAQVRMELARSGKYSEEFIESVTSGLAKSSSYAG